MVQLFGLEIFQTQFFGSPFGGARHDLHQSAGADTGACVGDETAFLAHQAIHIGGIQVDVARANQHFIVKRHGVAVIHIKQLGALAGVDATVPDFEFAGPLCNRKFLAVSHAPALALGIDHAGGVVPFAHAVLAYAYVNRMNCAL